MSRARLVITALVVEKQTVAEVATRYGVHRSWVYRLKARYDDIGEAAFDPLSRRPHTTPTAVAATVVELVRRLRKELSEAGLDAGPDTIAWHLARHHQITVSISTVARTLSREGLVTPEPKKRPKSSYLRFEAAMPNACWQSDFTHYRLSPSATANPAWTWRSSAGSTTAPATPCTAQPTTASPRRSCSAPPAKPQVSTGSWHRP
jgi:transposase